MRCGSILLAIALFSSIGFSAEIYVPDDQPTIQDAIKASAQGDTVVVRPGTYVENVNFNGKAITVRSELGPRVTVIDGNQTGSCVTFFSLEAADSVIEGFTLTNGSGDLIWGEGGGVHCNSSSSPTIRNNVIVKNTSLCGGGISCNTKSSPVIIGNLIMDNDGPSAGGGIFCLTSSSPHIVNNIITGNHVANATGGAIYIGYSSDPVITNNTFFANSAGNGGGIYVYQSKPKITNTIFWDNVPNELPAGLDVTYCDVKGGYAGTGNIDADPLFLDPAMGDFHIPFDSPCRSAGDRNAAGLPDIDFEGDPRTGLFAFPDIGADEFHAHFYIRGKVSPGGKATGVVIGWPKTNPVMLISGSGVSPTPDPTAYGNLWLLPPWEHRVHFNPIPDNGVRLIDRVVTTTLPPGTRIPLQALVGTELSNLWILGVE